MARSERISDYTSVKITKLQYLLSFFIIIYHAYNLDRYMNTGKILYYIEVFIDRNILAYSVVNLFFVISGVLFIYNIHSLTDFQVKIRKRIRSILIPYLFWGIAGYLYYLLLSSIPAISSKIGSMHATISWNDLYDAVAFCKFNSPLWYLKQLFLYFLLTPAIYLIVRNRYFGMIFTGFFFLLFLFGIDNQLLKLDRFPLYLSGLMIGIHGKSLVNTKFPTKISGLSLFGIILFGILLFFVHAELYSRIASVVLPYLGWVGFDLFCSDERKIWLFESKSMFIYCSHRVVLNSVQKLFLVIGGDNMVTAWADFILSPCITIMTLSCIAIILKKYLPSVCNFIEGGRG